MISAISSSTLLGVDGNAITVEVHVANGLPSCTIVGLPDASCREARDRVRAAFASSNLAWPQQRITVNLAPSNLRKMGTAFDLAIAVGVLVAADVIPPAAVDGLGFIGELGLDGLVHSVNGIVPLVTAAASERVVVSSRCLDEAAVSGRSVVGVDSLAGLVAVLTAEGEWARPGPPVRLTAETEPDLTDVRGQPMARWAIEVAAAGGHNVLFAGPPGSGKTMLARRLPGLLPDLDDHDAATATRVHSAAGLLSAARPLVWRPPFRSPHHTSTMQAIAGGGSSVIRPGEVSLAHGGVLFLDEIAEFPRSVLDTLRQPLESGELQISRAAYSVTLPARVLLAAAMNPCPCGEGFRPGACRCPDAVRARYRARLSGPLLDRFDLRVVVQRPKPESFFDQHPGESSSVVAERVRVVRELSRQRGVRCNAELDARGLDEWATLTRSAEALLTAQLRQGSLTARGLHRIRRIARTLADLRHPDGDPAGAITDEHVCAALELRPDTSFLAVAS